MLSIHFSSYKIISFIFLIFFKCIITNYTKYKHIFIIELNIIKHSYIIEVKSNQVSIVCLDGPQP